MRRSNFYPRPLRGGRLDGTQQEAPKILFLSTPSARRATPGRKDQAHEQVISIHALCEEGDLDDVIDHVYTFKFLSTPSARRATAAV